MASDAPSKSYVIRQTDGGMLGPLSLATLRDLLQSGHVNGDAQVSTDRQTFGPLAGLPELQDVLGAARLPRTGVPSYSGFLEEHSFYRVFFRLAIAKETGRMLIHQGEYKKEVFLVAGAPVFVGSNLPDERIGEFLITQGAISRQQLEDALVIVGNFGNHLGTTLMGMKVITPHRFYELLVAQLRLKLMAVVDWQVGRYDFYKDALYEGPKLPVEINSLEVLTDAMRTRLQTREQCEARLGERLTKPLVHTKLRPVAVERLGLNGVETRLYEAMNDMRTPEDLASDIAGSDHGRTALAMCYYMLELGFVDTV